MEWLRFEVVPPGEVLRVATRDLPEEGTARKIRYQAGADVRPRELVLCRVGGRLFALDSRCPHQGGRIADGPLIDGRHLHCPLHLYKFRPDDGAAVGVECPPATTFPVREAEGGALVDVHSGAG